jgi:hypothetical protein
MTQYFAKFPVTTYNGKECLNILRRVAMTEKTSRNSSLFYRYVLKEDTREDILAADYYDDPFLSWLIYFSNKIIDPYFGWYISEKELANSIIAEHGSISIAQRKLVSWRLNWHGTEAEITPTYYNNHLPGHLRQYYDPVFGPANRVISYRRKREDFLQSTNAITRIKINGDLPNVGEVLSFKDPAEVALGEITAYDPDTEWWYLKDLRGVLSEEDLSFIDGTTYVGDESGESGTVTDYELVYRSIPVDEQVYWGPFSLYDLYVERNERNKNVRLVKSEISGQVEADLERLLNG